MGEMKSQALDLKSSLNEALAELRDARLNRNTSAEDRAILRLQLLVGDVTWFLDKLAKMEG